MTDSIDSRELLHAVRTGRPEAVASLFQVVYDDLRRIAHRQLARGAPTTLSTTELVHEAYLRLIDGGEVQWRDRAHFAAIASRAMRYLLVDRARARTAQKRGGRDQPITLDDDRPVDVGAGPEELVAIDEALERLAAADPRLGQLVEYRFFAGMNYEEIAEVTGLSVPTAKRDWARARAWLYRFLRDEVPGAS
ncbi:MAG: sigma-70 family RNA polymerase sigma factor [Gemmatimonadetes bacterium]|nr:sigma-70 family RNA polymerase sigma factor [Gemmatimonadota bacterium]